MCRLCHNVWMNKKIVLDKRAEKEINKFSKSARIKLIAYLETLKEDGKLKKPFAKKINKDLYEIRIKHKGEWRVIYAYVLRNEVIILSAFRKKTTKLPIREINKAQRRLKEY